MSSSESWDIDKRTRLLVSLHHWYDHSPNGAELLVSARGGDKHCIDQIMKLGASVNTCDCLGRTPLILAANQGHVNCVESLIHTWAADVNATTRTDVEVCRTALACAAEKGHHQCMDILIQAGADVNATVNSKPLMLATVASQCESMRKLIKAGADVNATGEDGVTCLLVVCKHSYAECVELLIQQGADVNISDKEQNSPLIFTVAYWVNDNTLPCLKLLFLHCVIETSEVFIPFRT